MDKKNEKIILHGAIKKYGVLAQRLMMIEEMSELTKALCKYDRRPCCEMHDDVLEEMADVQIMLDQMEILFDQNKFLNIRRHDKLMRLKEKLNS